MSDPNWPPPAPPAYARPEPVAIRGELAGWFARVGATLVDGIVLIVFIGVLLAIAVAAGSEGLAAVAVVLFYALSFLYAPLLMMRSGERNGQTFGKQALGIRVVRETGEPFGFGWAFLREAIVKGFLTPLTFGIDLLWPLWDGRNQALHDKVAGTYVVRAQGT